MYDIRGNGMGAVYHGGLSSTAALGGHVTTACLLLPFSPATKDSAQGCRYQGDKGKGNLSLSALSQGVRGTERGKRGRGHKTWALGPELMLGIGAGVGVGALLCVVGLEYRVHASISAPGHGVSSGAEQGTPTYGANLRLFRWWKPAGGATGARRLALGKSPAVNYPIAPGHRTSNRARQALVMHFSCVLPHVCIKLVWC
jgi:hypothetical protein